MTLSRLETERIARSINALRPDWPIGSLETFIWQNLKHHAYADVAVALVAVATDARTATPARVLEQGPWWKACQALGGATTPSTPSRPQCQLHKGCKAHDDHPVGADRCPDCAPTLVKDPAVAHALAEAARAEIPAHRRGRALARTNPVDAARLPAEHAAAIREQLPDQEAQT